MCTAQLWQWSHTSTSMPPLPQIKAFLEIFLHGMALGQPGRGLTWFMWADPRYEGAVLLYEKEIETPPHQQGQSQLLEAAPAGETTGARVWGKGNATSQEDASFSHETDLKAEIKKQFKRSSSLFRGKRRSHPRPKQGQFFPQTNFSTAGTSPSEQRCPELSRLKKSLTTKDNSQI